MGTQGRTTLPPTYAKKRAPVASRFPVQHGIEELRKSLAAFNERIVELENEGHKGHAIEVLKANALDLARQIDELRCLLVGK
jgi:hypothetical protein